ncbi:MAG: FkbM family methyltransferase [Chthoniobacteraceae bacterium]
MLSTTGHPSTNVQLLADSAITGSPRLAGLTDQAVVERLIVPYFRSLPPQAMSRHVVDVGGAYGSVAAVFLQEGWTADIFEPDPACSGILEGITASFPGRCRLFPFAAGTANRDAVAFQQNSVTGLSGFDGSPFGQHQNVLSVRCVRLGEFLVSHGVTRVDLLKIDTEGSDFDVLEAHDFARLPPTLVFAEFSYFFPKQGPAVVGAAIAAMAERGYRPVIFEYDDDGNFHRGNWAHRLVAMHLDAARIPVRERSFGNVLFYRTDDFRLLDAIVALLENLR